MVQAVITMAKQLPKEGLAKSEKPSKNIDLVHYSVEPGLKQIDVNKMGTGAPAQEYKQGTPSVARAYYYRAGSKPEGLVTQGAKACYLATLNPTKHKLYDLGSDPEGLHPKSKELFLSSEGGESPEDALLRCTFWGLPFF